MIHSVDLLYAISGFCVSLLVGMTGVGGGSLMTPLLILLFGIHPATAVGTDLLYAAATKSGGTLVHGLNRNIDWRVVGRLAVGSVPATAVTLIAMWSFGIYSGAAQGLITTVLSGALVATAAVLILRKRILAFFAAHVGELSLRRTAGLTVLLGAVLGLLVSISSVGAGALGVTAIILLYPRLPSAHRRLRHRPCRAADPRRRHRPLDARLDRLASARLIARRLATGHRHRQLCVVARARRGLAFHIGDDPALRRRQARAIERRAK
jgi:uncharacterized membrane protein YfcA